MNSVQFFYLLVSLLLGIVLVSLLRTDTSAPRARTLLAVSLAVLIAALLCVGVVSHTIVRHIVQAVPALIALVLVARRSPLATAASAPVCTFWLGVMLNIWLFILGIARIFSGTFSTVEIVLTIVIAAASAAGILAIVRSGTRLSVAARLSTAAAFGIAQFAAMVASFQFA
jgi:hypothetical protein